MRDAGDLPPPEVLARPPGPVYDSMRARSPVRWDPENEAWVVTSYQAARTVAREDGRVWTKAFRPPISQDEMVQIHGGGSARNIVYADPGRRGYGDEHARLHNWLIRELSPARCDELRMSVVRTEASAAVNSLRPRGRAELFSDLAAPVPVRVFAAVLGLPADEKWIADCLALIDAAGRFRGHSPASPGRSEVAAALTAAQAVTDMLAPVVTERAARFDGSLLSALWRDADEIFDPGWGLEDIVGNARVLLRAGSGTTVSGTCNALYVLLTEPGLQAHLRSEPGNIRAFVEEVLRFYPPVSFTLRAATEATSLDGARIDQGQVMMVVNAAANRDPGHYDHPHAFDMQRPRPRDHFTFQRGVRSCVGQSFARTEIEEIVRATLGLGPITLDAEADPPTWGTRPGGVGHGRWTPLHVRWNTAE